MANLLLGLTSNDLERLPFGVAMPIKEALHQTAADPSLTLPPEAYRLIGEYTQKVIFFHIDLVTNECTANCVRKVWKWTKMN